MSDERGPLQAEARRTAPWQAEVVLLAADATKEIKAAPGVGKKLVVTYIAVTSLVAAAQVVDVEDGSGVEEILKLAATWAVNSDIERIIPDDGYELPENQNLRIQPAAAGPSIHVVAKGYIRGSF